MAEKYVLDDDGNPKLDENGNKILATPSPTPKPKVPDGVDPEVIKALVQEGIDAALKPIKENLDAAYAARDEALTKVATYEQKEREAEVERLKTEGEHQKAFELELAQERAAKEALQKRNTELSRDVEVRSALSNIEFRNENAAEMAYKEIVTGLVQNDDGAWIHKDGTSIGEHVKAFASNENNAFLLKQQVNTGTGSTATTTSPAGGDKKKSLFDIPQAEVLQMAAEGKLPSQKT